MKTINPLEYVDDEFQDIYRWIGVDMPVGADEENRSSNSRGKQKAVEDAVVKLRFEFSSWSLCSWGWWFFSDEQVDDQAPSESQTHQRWVVTQLLWTRIVYFSCIIEAPRVLHRLYPWRSLLIVDPHCRQARHLKARSSTLNIIYYSRMESLIFSGYRKAQEESDPHVSEEENIPEVEVETVTLIPKKKGLK